MKHFDAVVLIVKPNQEADKIIEFVQECEQALNELFNPEQKVLMKWFINQKSDEIDAVTLNRLKRDIRRDYP